jgi:hypothetical protein
MELLASRFWSSAVAFRASTEETPEALEAFVSTADIQVADAMSVLTLGLRYKWKGIEITKDLIGSFCNPLPFLENIGFDDAGFDIAFKTAQAALKRYREALTTAASGPTGSDNGNSATSNGDSPEAKEAAAIAAVETENRELSEALVTEAGLISHIIHNESYYRHGIWAKLSPTDRHVYLSFLGGLAEHAESEVLGFVGNKVALPIRLDRHPQVQTWLERFIKQNDGLQHASEPEEVSLPTKGVMSESRLGECTACDEFIVKHREMDIEIKQAEVRLARARARKEIAEAIRYTRRLQRNPPMLESPVSPEDGALLRVRIEKEPEEPQQ